MTHQCSCGSAHEEVNLGVQYSLHEKIEFSNFECLNECEEGSGASVFKTWENRLDTDKYVDSDVDEELLFNIPFTGNIKLKSIIVIGGNDELHPDKVRLYKNRPHMTFDDVSMESDQEFELHVDTFGVHEYPIKIVKFSSINHLSLHFIGKHGSEKTRIYYIGLKGEWSPGHQHGVTICTYEVVPRTAAQVPDQHDNDRAIS